MQESQLRAPTFFLRAGAAAVDGAVLFLPFYAIVSAGIEMYGGMQALEADPTLERVFLRTIGLVLAAASGVYFTLMTGRDGQTVGKKLADIKVVAMSGAKIGYGAAFARWVGYQVSVWMLGSGLALAAFTQHQRGAHDFLAGTRVVIAGGLTQWRKAALSVAGILATGAFAVAVLTLTAMVVESFFR